MLYAATYIPTTTMSFRVDQDDFSSDCEPELDLMPEVALEESEPHLSQHILTRAITRVSRGVAVSAFALGMLLPGGVMAQEAAAMPDAAQYGAQYYLDLFGPKADVDPNQARVLWKPYYSKEVRLSRDKVQEQDWDHDFVDVVQAYIWAYYKDLPKPGSVQSIQPTKETVRRWLDIVHAAFVRIGVSASMEETQAIIEEHKLIPSSDEMFFAEPNSRFSIRIDKTLFPEFRAAEEFDVILEYHLYGLEDLYESGEDGVYAARVDQALSALQRYVDGSDDSAEAIIKNSDYGLRKKLFLLCTGRQPTSNVTLSEATVLSELLNLDYAENSWVGMKKRGESFESTSIRLIDDDTKDYLQKSLSLLYGAEIQHEHLEFALREYKRLVIGYNTSTNQVTPGVLSSIHTQMMWRAHVMAQLGLVPKKYKGDSVFRTDRDLSDWWRVRELMAASRKLPKWEPPSIVVLEPKDNLQRLDVLKRRQKILWPLFNLNLIGLFSLLLYGWHNKQGWRFMYFAKRMMKAYFRAEVQRFVADRKAKRAAAEAREAETAARNAEAAARRQDQELVVELGAKLYVVDGETLDREARMAAHADTVVEEVMPKPVVVPKPKKQRVKKKKTPSEVVSECLERYSQMKLGDVFKNLEKGSVSIVFRDKRMLRRVKRSPHYRSFLRSLIELKYFYDEDFVRRKNRSVTDAVNLRSVTVSLDHRICLTKEDNEITIHFLGDHIAYQRALPGLRPL